MVATQERHGLRQYCHTESNQRTAASGRMSSLISSDMRSPATPKCYRIIWHKVRVIIIQTRNTACHAMLKATSGWGTINLWPTARTEVHDQEEITNRPIS